MTHALAGVILSRLVDREYQRLELAGFCLMLPDFSYRTRSLKGTLNELGHS
jgi:hypothetical protein